MIEENSCWVASCTNIRDWYSLSWLQFLFSNLQYNIRNGLGFVYFYLSFFFISGSYLVIFCIYHWEKVRKLFGNINANLENISNPMCTKCVIHCKWEIPQKVLLLEIFLHCFKCTNYILHDIKIFP